MKLKPYQEARVVMIPEESKNAYILEKVKVGTKVVIVPSFRRFSEYKILAKVLHTGKKLFFKKESLKLITKIRKPCL